jgi:hypothetical protein
VIHNHKLTTVMPQGHKRHAIRVVGILPYFKATLKSRDGLSGQVFRWKLTCDIEAPVHREYLDSCTIAEYQILLGAPWKRALPWMYQLKIPIEIPTAICREARQSR